MLTLFLLRSLLLLNAVFLHLATLYRSMDRQCSDSLVSQIKRIIIALKQNANYSCIFLRKLLNSFLSPFLQLFFLIFLCFSLLWMLCECKRNKNELRRIKLLGSRLLRWIAFRDLTAFHLGWEDLRPRDWDRETGSENFSTFPWLM